MSEQGFTCKDMALAALKENGYSVTDMVAYLLKYRRGTKKVLEYNGKSYAFHVVGISVNFELWTSIDDDVSFEVGFVSDH